MSATEWHPVHDADGNVTEYERLVFVDGGPVRLCVRHMNASRIWHVDDDGPLNRAMPHPTARMWPGPLKCQAAADLWLARSAVGRHEGAEGRAP